MYSWLKWTGTAALLAGLVGCTTPDETQTPTPGTAQLGINPSLRSIDNKGQNTTLRVFATDATGLAGTGDVTLITTAGQFANASKNQTLTLDSTGGASTTFSCSVSLDSACLGSVMIQGNWGSVSATTTLTLTGTPGGTDAGTPSDGGTTGGKDGGGGDNVTEPGKPANIIYDTPLTPPQLGIRSVGLKTATLVSFTVLDLAGKPVPSTLVNFSVIGPAGVSLVPTSGQTDATGKVGTVLQSGDEVGVATVSGQIITGSGGVLTASSQSIPIIGARVSDRGFVVECKQLVLAANMTETPPRKDISTECSANLSDRFTNQITQPATVTWYSESGAITSPVASDISGRAATTLSTAGKWPPVPVDPLSPGEPSVTVGGKMLNPRDMLVTLIAVTAGEEEFYDGSGASNGVKNGQWDPGEWFVDTPEPFVDANDNQVYDYGEAFIDTERLNCATGKTEGKNGKWDGPNGCWDGNTMLWHPTHVVYSGFNSVDPPLFTFDRTSPLSIPKQTDVTLHYKVTDSYLNLISQDSAAYSVSLVGRYGSVTLSLAGGSPNARTYGFQIIHERVIANVDSSPRGYSDGGLCDPGKPVASGASTDPKLARCVWQYRFGQFGILPNVGTAIIGGTGTSDPPVSEDLITQLGNTFGSATATFRLNFL